MIFFGCKTVSFSTQNKVNNRFVPDFSNLYYSDRMFCITNFYDFIVQIAQKSKFYIFNFLRLRNSEVSTSCLFLIFFRYYEKKNVTFKGTQGKMYMLKYLNFNKAIHVK